MNPLMQAMKRCLIVETVDLLLSKGQLLAYSLILTRMYLVDILLTIHAEAIF